MRLFGSIEPGKISGVLTGHPFLRAYSGSSPALYLIFVAVISGLAALMDVLLLLNVPAGCLALELALKAGFWSCFSLALASARLATFSSQQPVRARDSESEDMNRADVNRDLLKRGDFRGNSFGNGTAGQALTLIY